MELQRLQAKGLERKGDGVGGEKGKREPKGEMREREWRETKLSALGRSWGGESESRGT